jgi:hypothetical protein
VSPTTVELSLAPRHGATIESATPTRGLLVATLRRQKEGAQYELELTPRPPAETGEAFQTELLDVRARIGERRLVLRVQISVELRDRVAVVPSPSVYFRRTETAKDRDAPVEKSLELRGIGGPAHRFSVEGTRSRDGHFRTTVLTIDPGRRYQLKVTLVARPEAGQRFLKDVIEVTTDDPLVPLLTIPAMAQF